jgi:hypothetical protein
MCQFQFYVEFYVQIKILLIIYIFPNFSRNPSRKLTEPIGSAEHQLGNTALLHHFKGAFTLQPAYEWMAHERYRTKIRYIVYISAFVRALKVRLQIHLVYLVPIKLLSSELVLPKSRVFNLKIQKFLQDPSTLHYFLRFVQVSFWFIGYFQAEVNFFLSRFIMGMFRIP